MRTPQINGYEPTATPMYRNSNMMTPAIHGHESAYRDPSATPASYPAGPLATPSQVLHLCDCHVSHILPVVEGLDGMLQAAVEEQSL